MDEERARVRLHREARRGVLEAHAPAQFHAGPRGPVAAVVAKARLQREGEPPARLQRALMRSLHAHAEQQRVHRERADLARFLGLGPGQRALALEPERAHPARDQSLLVSSVPRAPSEADFCVRSAVSGSASSSSISTSPQP